MTTSPPQPPQNPYPGQPGGYGPPPEQFPQYTQPEQPTQPPGQYPGPQPVQAYQQQPFHQAPQQPGQQGQFPPPGQQAPQDHFAQQPLPAYPGAQMGLQCRFCGSFPAVEATVRGHQGLIILMRFLKLQGPFCRTCGIATVRDMTSKSLWQGWWGIGSSIINPITMLMNIGPMQKFKSLPEPAPGAPGRPMDPGKPLFRRPAILGLLLPILVIAAIVIANLSTTTTSEAAVGQCVVNNGTADDPDVKVVDCTSSEAAYKIIGKLDDSTDDSQCDQFEGVEASYTVERGSTKYTLCLAPV
ncbi:toxin-antitoxin system, toxin component [Kribbella pittospori]|uniref:Toxin-antitoxin system, toxin component n=1 Tax=Kribbella pittospori TaxID=722689 RepID=A0A4R0KQG6_9ACTN|nr:toxin-antitoxin system, toxin component [Kribbella pittospori]TCC61236.1 toxin-antitoxin system, toxin component [Kribbella pittospori]